MMVFFSIFTAMIVASSRFLHILRYYKPIRRKKQEENLKFSQSATLRLIFLLRNGKVWEKEGFPMKITYNQPKYLSPAPAAASWLRRLVLAWLTGAAAEYLLLSAELRSLSGLEGIAAMSMLRMALIAAGVFLICAVLQKRIPETVERILIFIDLLILSTTALVSSFTWPFWVPVC
jgi:hypothetical protein